MYKNPELSSRARILARELKAMGVEIRHTQALDLLAKTEGARNLHVHQAVVASPEEPTNVLEGKLYDWTEFDSDAKAAQTERQKQVFDAKVELFSDSLQVTLRLPCKEGESLEGTDQLSLSIEIDKGRPRVEVSNDVEGYPPLRITTSPGGLYLSPTTTDVRLCSGTPQDEDLQEIQSEAGHSSMWDLFMENPNHND